MLDHLKGSSMKLFILMLLATAVSFAQSAKVVYDLRSGEIMTIQYKLIDSLITVARDYAANGKSVDIMVVISDDAYKFFIDDLENSPYANDEDAEDMQMSFKPALEKLHKRYGVTFNMCHVGMRAKKIKKKSLYPFVNAQKTRSVYLIDAQNDGYAYLPVF